MANKSNVVKVVVNGEPVDVSVNENEALEAMISHALTETKNTGQPRENWVLKDAAGNIIDPTQKLRDLKLSTPYVLYLSLKAGVGG